MIFPYNYIKVVPSHQSTNKITYAHMVLIDTLPGGWPYIYVHDKMHMYTHAHTYMYMHESRKGDFISALHSSTFIVSIPHKQIISTVYAIHMCAL